MEYESDKVALEAAGHLFKKIGNHDPKTIAKVLSNGKSHPLIKLESKDLGDEGLIPISMAFKQDAAVTSLDLSSNKITHAGVTELCKSLESNQFLLYLKLDNNDFGDQGVVPICQLLKSKKCVLRSLYLSDCGITSKGVALLADAISSNHSLETLHLNSNRIGNDGAIVLSKLVVPTTKFKNLSLFCCSIGDPGANAFLSILEKPDFEKYPLITLNLKGNKIANLEKINKIMVNKKTAIKNHKLKMEAQKLINEEAEKVIQLRMISVHEEVERKIKDIDQEHKKKYEERIKDIDQENKKKLDEKIKDISHESQKKLNEKLKTIEKNEESRNSEFGERLKEFEKSRKSSDKSSNGSSSSSKNSLSNNKKKKKYSDSIIIVIAGDKAKDKEVLIDYCMSALEDCKIEAENDFEKIFTGIIKIDDKPIHFTFVNTSSDDRYSRLRALQYEQADAAVIAFTTFDRVSFEDIPFQWIPEIQFMGKIPIFISGMYPEKRSNPPKSTDITEKEGRENSLKFGASNYFEPVGSDDIKDYIDMFGFVIPGRPAQNQVQTIAPNKFLFQIDNAADINNFAIFLTVDCPIGQNAAIYLSWAPYQNWSYLGYLNSKKPSEIFTLLHEGDKTQILGNRTDSVQIGINIETDQEVESKAKTGQYTDNMIFRSVDFKQFAFKMCHNLVNYILSFQGSNGAPNNMVPTNTIDKWYENFQKKIQKDVIFWKEN
ncbi:hypothetical protein CYY_006636 [Polysphondylium violaceum]|uniref:Uncharacterized protein n=1 Tax=Polysphondylium violaceum TaxID=133409 RepID=A0A8J4URD8_9MYCE|nr:hypothetical protein CYY_006636 [Polysphondylium violaceum]